MIERYGMDTLQKRREFKALAETLFALGPRAQAISAAVGLVLVMLLWSWSEPALLLGWYVVLLLSSLWRIALIQRRRRLDPGAELPKSLVRSFQIGVACNGLVWGLAPLVLLPEPDLIPLTMVIVVLAGMVSGGVAVLSGVAGTFALFAVPALFPVIVLLFLQGQIGTSLLGLLGLFYLFMIRSVSGDLHRILKGRIQLALQLRRERDLAFTTVKALAEGVVRVRPDGQISYINDAAAAILDLEPESAIDHLEFEHIFPVTTSRGERVWELVRIQVIEGGLPLDVREDLWFTRGADGDPELRGRWLQVVARPLLDEQDQLIEVIIVMRDRTLERMLFDRLEHHARHDPLTGLGNRRSLGAALRRAIENARKHPESSAMLLFLDLDGFKQVNDRAGHLFGDRMLVRVAREMSSELRSEDLLCRIGGDEFALLLRDTTSEEAAVVSEKLAERVTALNLDHQQREYGVGLSVGIASIDAAMEPDQIIEKADQACYAAKKNKRRRKASGRSSPG